MEHLGIILGATGLALGIASQWIVCWHVMRDRDRARDEMLDDVERGCEAMREAIDGCSCFRTTPRRKPLASFSTGTTRHRPRSQLASHIDGP